MSARLRARKRKLRTRPRKWNTRQFESQTPIVRAEPGFSSSDFAPFFEKILIVRINLKQLKNYIYILFVMLKGVAGFLSLSSLSPRFLIRFVDLEQSYSRVRSGTVEHS